MDCPYCKKDIYAMTGLQEIQKFQKHMRTCRKAPGRQTVVTAEGKVVKQNPGVDMMEALEIRAKSGQ